MTRTACRARLIRQAGEVVAVDHRLTRVEADPQAGPARGRGGALHRHRAQERLGRARKGGLEAFGGRRVRELEEEREAHARLSVRYERARIASELHDIVAHAISVMVVQVGAGQRLAAVDPGLTAEAFRAIGDAARQAEDDMGAPDRPARG